MPFVYFIHEDGNVDCFKIGKTSIHPADRCEQLQTGNPRKLIIYRWIELPNHSEVEEFLHRKYASACIRGEWFHISRDIVDMELGIIMSLNGAVGVVTHVKVNVCKDVNVEVNTGKDVCKGVKVNVCKDVNVEVSKDIDTGNEVKVSAEYPKWTQDDILQVQNERVKEGSYRGKYTPKESMRRKKKYWEDMRGDVGKDGSKDAGKDGSKDEKNTVNTIITGFSDEL